MTPGEVLLAHHAALLAVPAVLPAVILAGLVLWIVRKDRREEAAREHDPDDPLEER